LGFDGFLRDVVDGGLDDVAAVGDARDVGGDGAELGRVTLRVDDLQLLFADLGLGGLVAEFVLLLLSERSQSPACSLPRVERPWSFICV